MSEREVRVYRGYYVVADQEAGRVSIMEASQNFICTADGFEDAETIIDSWKDAR